MDLGLMRSFQFREICCVTVDMRLSSALRLSELARVELDDQLFSDGKRDGFAVGDRADRAGQRVLVEVQPLRLLATARGFDRELHAGQAFALVAQGDLVT